MNLFPRSIRAITAAIFFLALVGDAALTYRDALGRAGRGESYRSSGSSSGSGSGSGSSRDYHDRSGRLTPSYRSTAPSGSGSSAPLVQYPKEYDINYDINSFSAVLKVNGDGTVSVTETFDVTINKEQQGIARPMHKRYLFNELAISNVSSPQGFAYYMPADYGSGYFAFGYKDKKVTGRHVLTLNYDAIGMVLPRGSGSRLLWRSNIGKEAKIDSVKITIPGGATPVRATATLIPLRGGTAMAGGNLQCVTAGNQVTVPINRKEEAILDVTVHLPQGAVDTGDMRAGLKKLLAENRRNPAIREYRSSMTVNDNMSVNIEDSYEYAPDSPRISMKMWYLDYLMMYESSAKAAGWVQNRLCLYGFDKRSCGMDDYSFDGVCVPAPETGQSKTGLRYSMHGNFNPEDPFFLEFKLPPTTVKTADGVHFEVALPSFVKKDRVVPMLYLYTGSFDSEAMLGEADFEGRWEGNKLIGDYRDGLYDEQYLKLRILLPREGFKTSGPGLTAWLSRHWYFNRWIFIGVVAAIALLAGGGTLAFRLMKQRKGTGGA